MSESDFSERLLSTFRVEAREHLDGISSGLVQLEEALELGPQLQILETIFRQAHSMKGAARSIGAAEIATACQPLESVFSRIKAQQLQISPELLDSLHRTVDYLRRQILGANLSEADPARASYITAELNRWLQPGEPRSQLDESRPQTAQFPPGAGAATPSAPETVRIATAKLDSVLFQAEQVLSTRLTVGQRARDLEKLEQDAAGWGRERTKIRGHIGALKRALDEAEDGSECVVSRQTLRSVADFLSWEEEFMRLVRAELTQTAQQAGRDDRALGGTVDRLLETAKEALMLPFASFFELLPKLVRDLAREQHKEVKLQVHGGDLEIDRSVLEEIKDPIIHLVRNGVDHGIEPPAERERAGKAPSGTVTIAVSQKSGGLLELIVSDDGAGLDVPAIKTRAVQAGFRSAGAIAGMNDAEALRLVFESGLSTSARLTEISGRGLGLAIVREKLEKLSGTVALENHPGAGATFRLLLPTSLARFKGVLVRAGGRPFIVPTSPIQRVGRVAASEIRTVQNREAMQYEGEMLPLARLAEILRIQRVERIQSRGSRPMPFLVLGERPQQAGFLLDEIVGEQEVLMKRLGPQLSRVRHVSGATVLGDGRVVPILNVNDLLKSALGAGGARASGERVGPGAPRKRVLVAEDSITSRTLLKHILLGAGYRVETAVDGTDALNALKTRKFDLLVSDVDMPRLNGFDLTMRIRADPQLANLPVVLVTALGSRQDEERGMEAGANAYVVKSSIDQSNLVDVVGRLTH